MEIVTYVINGSLTHADSIGNRNTLTRGQVQYMSAGTGIFHSEHNLGDEPLRLLQIWIFPDKKGYTPQYGDYDFDWDHRKNKWLPIVSGVDGTAPIKIHHDVNLYVTELDKGNIIHFPVKLNRQAYLIQIEGESIVNGFILNTQDAMEVENENLFIKATELSHFIIIEMNKLI